MAAVMGLAGSKIQPDSVERSLLDSRTIGATTRAFTMQGEGDNGGTASVNLAINGDGGFTGTVTYTNFTVIDGEDSYALSGSITMSYDFDMDMATTPMTISSTQAMDGSITVAKNGGAATTFVIDLDITVAMQMTVVGDQVTTTGTVTVTGSVGSETINEQVTL